VIGASSGVHTIGEIRDKVFLCCSKGRGDSVVSLVVFASGMVLLDRVKCIVTRQKREVYTNVEGTKIRHSGVPRGTKMAPQGTPIKRKLGAQDLPLKPKRQIIAHCSLVLLLTRLPIVNSMQTSTYTCFTPYLDCLFIFSMLYTVDCLLVIIESVSNCHPPM